MSTDDAASSPESSLNEHLTEFKMASGNKSMHIFTFCHAVHLSTFFTFSTGR